MALPKDVRLSEGELAALRTAMSVHSGAERRRHVRHALPEGFTLVVRLQAHGGTGATTITASARDISSSGMGFFHSAYIHPGTPCHLLMKTLKGDAVGITGTVARCRHVSGRIHEAGVIFEHEIELSQFVQGSTVPVNGCKGDVQAQVAHLVQELRSMVDQRAAMTTLLSKVGELALILAPFHPAEVAATPPNQSK